MDSKSMMELTKELDAEFDNLVNNCMTSGAIDLNLYQEYDVKGDFVIVPERVY